MIDLSGLETEIISAAIANFGLERIIFGSDALYHEQWKAVAMFLQCIEKSALSPEKSFIQIAHQNPKRYALRGEDDVRFTDQDLPVA